MKGRISEGDCKSWPMGLTFELAALRDEFMCLLEAKTPREGDAVLQRGEMIASMRSIAALSDEPDFWHTVEATLPESSRNREMDVEAIGKTMLKWLQIASTWDAEEKEAEQEDDALPQVPTPARGRSMSRVPGVMKTPAAAASAPTLFDSIADRTRSDWLLRPRMPVAPPLGLSSCSCSTVLTSWRKERICATGSVPHTAPSASAPRPIPAAQSLPDTPRKMAHAARFAGSMTARASSRGGGEGMPVFLHIYDVSHQGAVQWLNDILSHWLSPVKLGGAFHTGVEVNGLEWSFGYSIRERTGVTCVLPRSDKQHHFRQTVYVGDTRCSEEAIASTVSSLVEEYPGPTYHLLKNNCCHFAEDFCSRLGVGPIPGWVHRFARMAAHAEEFMQAITGNQEDPASNATGGPAAPPAAGEPQWGQAIDTCSPASPPPL